LIIEQDIVSNLFSQRSTLSDTEQDNAVSIMIRFSID